MAWDMHFHTATRLELVHGIVHQLLVELVQARVLDQDAIERISHRAVSGLAPWREQAQGLSQREELLQKLDAQSGTLFDLLAELARSHRS